MINTKADFTEQEIEMIDRLNEIFSDDRYPFDVWDYNLNKKNNENIIEYLKRQKITDSKIVEFMKSTTFGE